jgi:hypothetical protein
MPLREKRLVDSRCFEPLAVEATAVSAVVALVGSARAGPWKLTRCCRRYMPVLGGEPTLPATDAVLLALVGTPGMLVGVTSEGGKWTVGAGLGATSVGACDPLPLVLALRSKSKSVAASMSDARPCIECGLLCGDGSDIESLRGRVVDVLRNRLRVGASTSSGSGSGSGAGFSHRRIVRLASDKVTARWDPRSSLAPTT